jgi:hypothetical protein
VTLASDNRFDEDLFRSLRELIPGQCSPDGSAIVGQQDYMFIHGGSNRWNEQISGELVIPDDAFERTLRIIAETRAECALRDIRLSIAIVPEKDVVYPEASPNCAGVALGKRSVHRMLAEVPDVRYSWEELICHKHVSQLYHKFDSHFNCFGGLIVTNQILSAAGYAPILWDELRFTHKLWQDDLSVKWSPLQLYRRTLVDDYQETLLAAGNPLTGTHIAFVADDEEREGTAIVYGDSYSWNPDAAISRFLLYRFKQVHFIWSRSIDWTLVDSLNPALLVIQSAERFLISGLFRG